MAHAKPQRGQQGGDPAALPIPMMHSVSEDSGASLLLQRRQLNGSTPSVLLSPRSGKATSLYGDESDVAVQGTAEPLSPAQSHPVGTGSGIGLGLGELSTRMRSAAWFEGSMPSTSALSGSALATSQEFSPRTPAVGLPAGAVPLAHRRGRRSSSSSRASAPTFIGGPAHAGSVTGTHRPPSVQSAAGSAGGTGQPSTLPAAPPTMASVAGSTAASGRRASSNSSLRTRMDILANANMALAQGHHKHYVYASPSTPSTSLLASPGTASVGIGGSSTAPSPMPMPRGRSVSTFSTNSSMGGSVGHGPTSPHAHPQHHSLHPDDGHIADDGQPDTSTGWVGPPHRRSPGARSCTPSNQLSASAADFAATYEIHAGGIDPRRSSSGSGEGISIGGCGTKSGTKARHRLSLPDAAGMHAGGQQLSASPIPSPRSVSGSDQLAPSAYFHASPAPHSPWFNNTSPHAHNLSTTAMGAGGSNVNGTGSAGGYGGGSFRSPFPSDHAGRLQPIPATAPPSEDGHGSSGRSTPDADAADTADAGSAVPSGSSAGRRHPSDGPPADDGTQLPSGRHGVDRSSGSGSGSGTGTVASSTQTLPRSPRLAMPSTSYAEDDDANVGSAEQTEHGRVVSPGGASKPKRRGRKALTEKLKRRSKRISANPGSHPTRSGSGSVEEDRRKNAGRERAADSDVGSDDSGDESLAGDERGSAADLDEDDSDTEERNEQRKRDEAAAIAAAEGPESQSRPNSRRHRALTSPVQKLASASASTLDFGNQLGMQEGSRRTSTASLSTAGSPSGAIVSGGAHVKRIITPTSPLLLPSTPSSPSIGPVSHASASGVFLGKGTSAGTPSVLERSRAEGRENTSPVPDRDGASSAASNSRSGTNASTTPRLPLAALSPEQPINTATTVAGADLRRTSGTGGEFEDEETFFDANDTSLGLSVPRAHAHRSGLTSSESTPSVTGDMALVDKRARSSTLVGASHPISASKLLDGGVVAGMSGSNSADSDLSATSEFKDSGSSSKSILNCGSSGDDDIVGSSGAESLGRDAPSATKGRPRTFSNALDDPPNMGPVGETRPTMGGRAGDPLSTATLRQDASEHAKLERASLDANESQPSPVVESRSSPLWTQLDGASAMTSSPVRPATLIRTRTGSILPMARDLPTTPPPLAPLHIRGPPQAGTPIVIESPATPETPATATFAGPMQISTGMPSPDLQMVEPQAFNFMPIEQRRSQATVRGRPRGASVGAVPGSYAPLRPSSLAVSTSSLAPVKQSPGPEESLGLGEDEEDDEHAGTGAAGSEAHRRSGSGLDGSTSSHILTTDSGSPSAGSRDRDGISGGVSDHTNTSHSHSAASFATTDVSSSDTSVSVHENELDALSTQPEQQRQHQHQQQQQQPPLPQPQPKLRDIKFQHAIQERLPSSANAESSSMKNRNRAKSLGVPSALTARTPVPGQAAPIEVLGGAAAAAATAASSNSASTGSTSTASGRGRSGSTASLQRQAQLPLRSPASFVLAVVGHRGSGKTTVIKRGLKQYGLSKPNSLSEKVTSYSTFCLVDNSERTIEVLEIDAAVLLNGPTKRFSWPKFLPSIDAVILCYDASEVSSFRSMSELLENFSVHGVRTVMLACKSDIEPKALNPYYASEMAAMYNVGLAECTYHTEEGRKRMRNCFSYLVKGVAKARAGKGGSRPGAPRLPSQLSAAGSDVDGSVVGGAAPQQLDLSSQAPEMGRARGHSVPNVRFSLNNRSANGIALDGIRDENCRVVRQDPHHRCSARCMAGRKMSNATNESSEPLSMSNSEDEASSDQRHRSMMRDAQLGVQSARLQGSYDTMDEVYNKFFYSAVSNTGRDFATTFMIIYRGFATPADLLTQAITRFEVLADQEKLDEEVIRYSLIRMATMLREWVVEYPGDLSSPDVYPVLMGFYNRLLEHRHCADVVRVAEDSFKAAAFAPDLDAAWSARHNSHKPSSVAADYPSLNTDPSSVLASPASGSLAAENSVGSEGRLMPSVDISFTSNEGRPRADSGSVMASPASLADSQSSGAVTDLGRLSAPSNIIGRDRSLSNATSISLQPSLTSSESASVVSGLFGNMSSPSASSINASYPRPSSTLDAASVKARLRAASDALLDADDARIAQELTIMAWSIFMSIRPRDLLRHALVPPDQRPNGPCMQEIRHFNYISAWVVNMILSQSKLKNRSRLMEKFLNVAVLCREQNDYATLYCIIGAMESQTIYRLGNSWHLIDKDVQKQYNSMRKLMDSSRSYASYRLALQNSSGRMIPHLGVIYQDFVSIAAGNPSKALGDGSIHWRKFELMSEALEYFLIAQQCTDSVGQSDLALRKQIIDLPIMSVEDDALMERSKALEPEGRVRRGEEAWMSVLSRRGKRLFASASNTSTGF